MGDPAVCQEPLVISTAGQFLAASALHAFPNTALSAPTAADRRDADRRPCAAPSPTSRPTPGGDIDLADLADLAAAAYVTPRAIQYAFQQHLGTTPMAYLRRVRLEAAYHDLLAADPTRGDTVTTIAARWGFAHPGRFASAYRRTYGISPSATLRD